MIFSDILSHKDRVDLIQEFLNSNNIVRDHQAYNTYTLRKPAFLNKYLRKVKKIVESKTNLHLIETFSGIRLYQRGDKLEKHFDNASEYALTIIVYQSDDKSNLLVFYPDGIKQLVDLKEGEGYAFNGMEVEHERLEVQSNYLLHIYLGYTIKKNKPTVLI